MPSSSTQQSALVAQAHAAIDLVAAELAAVGEQVGSLIAVLASLAAAAGRRAERVFDALEAHIPRTVELLAQPAMAPFAGGLFVGGVVACAFRFRTLAMPRVGGLLPSASTAAPQQAPSPSPPARLEPYEPKPQPYDDGFSSPGNSQPTVLVRPPAVHVPGGLAVIDGALEPELARRAYAYTVQRKESWGTYVLLEGAAEGAGAAPELKAGGELEDDVLGLEVVRSFLAREGGRLLAPAMGAGWVHGFEVWAVKGPEGHQVSYHIDYAEWHRKQTNELCPPLLAITLQLSPFEEGEMGGGEYGANENGLAHYDRCGYKCVRLPPPNGVPSADWDDPAAGWRKVPYRFNRATVHPGEWAHAATRVTRLPRGEQRVVVGINPFTHYVGPHEMVAPQHSEAFRRQLKMDKLRAAIQGKGGEKIDLRNLDLESKRLLVKLMKKQQALGSPAKSNASSSPAL